MTDYRTTQLESLLLAARQRLAWLLWALLFLFSFYGNGSILTILLRRKLLRCTLPISTSFFSFFGLQDMAAVRGMQMVGVLLERCHFGEVKGGPRFF